MAATGADVVDARIFTLSNGMALDTFLIQDEGGAPFDRADRIAKLASAIERALGGTLRVDKALEARKPTLGRRQRALKIPPRVRKIGGASCRNRVCQSV